MAGKDFTQSMVVVALGSIGLWFLLGALGVLDKVAELLNIVAVPTLGAITALYAVGTILMIAAGLKLIGMSPRNTQDWVVVLALGAIAAGAFYFAPDIAGGNVLTFAIQSVTP